MLVRTSREGETGEARGRVTDGGSASPRICIRLFSNDVCRGGCKWESFCFLSALGTGRCVATENNGGGSGIVTLNKVEEFRSRQFGETEWMLTGGTTQRICYCYEFMSGSNSANSNSAICCPMFLPHYPFIQKKLWQNWILFVNILSSSVKNSPPPCTLVRLLSQQA